MDIDISDVLLVKNLGVKYFYTPIFIHTNLIMEEIEEGLEYGLNVKESKAIISIISSTIEEYIDGLNNNTLDIDSKYSNSINKYNDYFKDSLMNNLINYSPFRKRVKSIIITLKNYRSDVVGIDGIPNYAQRINKIDYLK